jgi:hypothetical protein
MRWVWIGCGGGSWDPDGAAEGTALFLCWAVAEHFDETVEADAVRAVGDAGDLDAALECVGVQAYWAFFLVLRIDVDFGVLVDKLGRCIAGSLSSSC